MLLVPLESMCHQEAALLVIAHVPTDVLEQVPLGVMPVKIPSSMMVVSAAPHPVPPAQQDHPLHVPLVPLESTCHQEVALIVIAHALVDVLEQVPLSVLPVRTPSNMTAVSAAANPVPLAQQDHHPSVPPVHLVNMRQAQEPALVVMLHATSAPDQTQLSALHATPVSHTLPVVSVVVHHVPLVPQLQELFVPPVCLEST